MSWCTAAVFSRAVGSASRSGPVIYCSCPNEISAAWMAKQLSEAGFSDVLPLRGGMEAWRDSGKPVDALPELPPPVVAVDEVAPKAV